MMKTILTRKDELNFVNFGLKISKAEEYKAYVNMSTEDAVACDKYFQSSSVADALTGLAIICRQIAKDCELEATDKASADEKIEVEL